MKKFWTLALTCAMVLGMAGVPVPVYAAGEETAAENTAQAADESAGEATEDAGHISGEDEETTDAMITEDETEPAEEAPVVQEIPANDAAPEDDMTLENSGFYVDTDEVYLKVLPGKTVTLTPTVSDVDADTELYYHWYKDTGADELEEIEADDSSYTVQDPMTGDDYYVFISEDSDETEEQAVHFHIDVMNGLDADCVSAVTLVGGSVTVKANATARDLSNLSYRWCYITWNENYEETREYIEGADQRTYYIESATLENTENLYCEVTDRYGNTCDAEADISLNNRVREKNTKDDDFVVDLGSSRTLTADVTAIDTSGLTYTWYRHPLYSYIWNLDTADLIEDATGSEYTVNDVQYGYAYTCVIGDQYDEVELSIDYTVMVNSGFEADYAGDCETDLCGNVGEAVTMKVSASADLGSVHYAWYQLEEEYGTERTALSGSGAEFAVKAASEAQYFCCEVTDDYGAEEDIYFNVYCHCWKYEDCEPATLTANGVKYYYCEHCFEEKQVTVYSPKTFTLSATSYTYDGKVKTPTLTIKDSKGNVIKSSYYTVTWPSGRKNVGTYTIKVTFKSYYSGTKSLSFKINPKGTSLTKVTAASKGFKAYWTKQATQTTGYQIRYSTSSAMTGAKTVTIKKNTTIYQSVTKLTAKKKYYVQVRTYKTVSGTNYYSAWSKAVAVTTK